MQLLKKKRLESKTVDFSPFKTKFLALKKIDQSAEGTVKQMYALSVFT